MYEVKYALSISNKIEINDWDVAYFYVINCVLFWSQKNNIWGFIVLKASYESYLLTCTDKNYNLVNWIEL